MAQPNVENTSGGPHPGACVPPPKVGYIPGLRPRGPPRVVLEQVCPAEKMCPQGTPPNGVPPTKVPRETPPVPRGPIGQERCEKGQKPLAWKRGPEKNLGAPRISWGGYPEVIPCAPGNPRSRLPKLWPETGFPRFGPPPGPPNPQKLKRYHPTQPCLTRPELKLVSKSGGTPPGE